MQHPPDKSFYIPRHDGWQATQWTRGPWSNLHQHGGPPAALLLRAIEQVLAADAPMRIARVTWEMLRPIPIDYLRVATHTLRAGRKVRWLGASLIDADDREIMRANAVCIRAADMPLSVPAFEPPLPPAVASAQPFEFAFFAEGDSYRKAMEMRRARGKFGAGAVAMWMRMRIPLLPDESPSPAQRVACAVDSGSGISMALDTDDFTFINPDLNLYLLRPAAGEWVGVDACTRLGQDGTGLCESRVFDEQGLVGSAQQSLIIEPCLP